MIERKYNESIIKVYNQNNTNEHKKYDDNNKNKTTLSYLCITSLTWPDLTWPWPAGRAGRGHLHVYWPRCPWSCCQTLLTAQLWISPASLPQPAMCKYRPLPCAAFIFSFCLFFTTLSRDYQTLFFFSLIKGKVWRGSGWNGVEWIMGRYGNGMVMGTYWVGYRFTVPSVCVVQCVFGRLVLVSALKKWINK